MAINWSYSQYSLFNLDQRIDFFDQLNLELVIEDKDNRSFVKYFLIDTFKNEPNQFLKAKALEWLAELGLVGYFRAGYVQDFLLDISFRDDQIDVLRLKYAFLICGESPDALELFHLLCEDENAEVSSEAQYRLGLVKMFSGLNLQFSNEALQSFGEAEKYFYNSIRLAENRVDAKFFLCSVSYLKAVLSLEMTAAEQLLDELSEYVWQRQIWGWKKDSDIFELEIFRSFKWLFEILQHTSQESEWVNYKEAFYKLSDLFSHIIILSSLSNKFSYYYKRLSQSINNIVSNYYTLNLSATRKKIDLLIADNTSDDIAFRDFLLDLKLKIDNGEKSNNINSTVEIAKLARAYPNITPDRIASDYIELSNDLDDPKQALVALLFKYQAENDASRRSIFQTGFKGGDELLHQITSDLKAALVKYNQVDFEIFLTVLSDIIRYAYSADTQPKQFFPYLFDSKLKLESQFQNELYKYLTNGPRASNYRYEPADRISGGRIDIVYEEQSVVIPIEVKRDFKPSTWEKIRTDYVAQAQTYTLPYSQLGFLIIFEISPKKGTAPVSDIKDRFALLHTKPLYSLSNSHPDFVVACIIPGNKVVPSINTTYSKK